MDNSDATADAVPAELASEKNAIPGARQDADLAPALHHTQRLLAERVKELECVHGMSRLFDRKDATLQETLQGVVELIPLAWQYPEVAEAAITVDGESYHTAGFRELPWRCSSGVVAQDEVVGSVVVCYREEMPVCDQGPFLAEEVQLLGTIARRVSGYVERQKVLKSLLLYQQDLRELAAALSLSEQQERRRIAEGLHDNIGQNLALLNMRLSAAQQTGDIGEVGRLLSEARELAAGIITDTRSLTFELCPPILYELGLTAALDWLVEQMMAVHGYAAILQRQGEPVEISEHVAITLFQAVRELLNNAGRHGRATRVSVTVVNQRQQIRVVVEDNGTGFDPDSIAPRSDSRRSFGLFNIRERVRLLGGNFILESERGAGTVACLVIPTEERS